MPSAYGPIFVRCRLIYIFNYINAQRKTLLWTSWFLSGLRQSAQSNFYRTQKSDPIYYRSYCAVTKADMDPLFDHGPVNFYLTGFGAHDMIFIADK